MISLRVLTESDVTEWRRLRLEALLLCPRAYSASREEALAMPVDAFAARLSSGENLVYGAYDGETLVGTVGLMRQRAAKERHKGLIWGVYVAPSQRRHGLGRRLMAAVIDHARTIDGLRQLHLGVATDNAPACALYERLGFSRYGTEPRALMVDGEAVDEDLMVLRLDA